MHNLGLLKAYHAFPLILVSDVLRQLLYFLSFCCLKYKHQSVYLIGDLIFLGLKVLKFPLFNDIFGLLILIDLLLSLE